MNTHREHENGAGPPERYLYTAAEAADLLAVGRTSVYEFMADGRLPSVRIGRRRRIKAADLRAFVEDLAHDEG
ncbi:helix-turn-helix domain-containing protein [Gemmatimonas sp.]|uniref:helix-turn-helix domain-containing protein n=1 Tax=Gemmatimonas sp. TaxID=1962908 RepID=UPI0035629A56